MPLMVTDACILCGACEPVCPNKGIRKGKSVYVIDQDACTECVGFFDKQQCAVVCPMDCCVFVRGMVLTEEALFERAKALHANSEKQPTLTAETSRFRTSAGRTWWQRLFQVRRQPEAERTTC